MNGLIVGGGIAGLACAHALLRQAPGSFSQLTLWERAPRFEEVGAGVQLGPNATRLLQQWGLGDALAQVAFTPQHLAIYATAHNRQTAERALGAQTLAQYGAPSYTLHRADLHQVLLEAVRRHGQVALHNDMSLKRIDGLDQGASLNVGGATSDAAAITQAFDVVLGCDGGFSQVREHVLHDGPPQPTGQVAYRAMLPISAIKNAGLRRGVTVWMGRNMHAVAYPVRAGTLYNLVVIVQDSAGALRQGWDLRPMVERLPLPEVVHNRDLAALIEAVDQWRYWVLCDRAPLTDTKAMRPHYRVALLGDAAHPMLPFLAQGAAMAIEDAYTLAQSLGAVEPSQWHRGLERYSQSRWQRNARVQAGARRNAHVFHFSGPMAWARDAALTVAARRLLDMPWLYGGPESH